MSASYSNIADLANPQIDPEQWQIEVEEDAYAAASRIEEMADALNARAAYFERAGMPPAIVAQLHDAAGLARSSQEAMDAAANAVGEYVISLDLPDFEAVT